MSRVNDQPVSLKNPFPQVIVAKDLNTGEYIEVDSTSPLHVVLSNAVPVSGQTLISFDDGNGNPVTIAQQAGVQEVHVTNQNTSNIIQLDDGNGNPVTVAHVLGVLQVDLVDKHSILSVDDGAGNPVPVPQIAGIPKSLVQFIDPVSGMPFGVRNVNGKQRVTSSQYYTEVALGNVAGHEAYNITGSNLIVPLVKTLASNLALPVLPKLAIPAAVSVVSTSALDTGSAIDYLVSNPAGYPIGATVINVDGGIGNILATDTITFAGDLTIYPVVSYVPNVLPATGGVLTLATPLVAALADRTPLTVTALTPGTGIKVVQIHGIDALGFELSEKIVMTGITPVLSNGIYSAINTIHAYECGITQLGAAGTITVTGGLSIIQQIDIGGTRSRTAYFCMPKNKKGIVTQVLTASTDRGLVVSVEATVDPVSRNLLNCFLEGKTIISDKGTTVYEFSFPPFIPPGAEVRLMWYDSQAKGISGDLSFELLEEDL